MPSITAEHNRLVEQRAGTANWRRWGPYLSERAWGTVREDYSADGDAWNYFPHDQARSRAYRWNEDGLGGFCDDKQTICLAVALWNEQDPILKERMFGLTNLQGNHGEDVKEYYFFLDGTPTHSYMKMLYKYPQVAYPYGELVQVNGQRYAGRTRIRTIRCACVTPSSPIVTSTCSSSMPKPTQKTSSAVLRPSIAAPIRRRFTSCRTCGIATSGRGSRARCGPRSMPIGPGAAHTEHEVLGERWWYARADDRPLDLLFTENETNVERLYHVPNTSPYVKDGINDAVVNGTLRADRVNAQQGSKLAGHAQASVAPGQSFTVEVRFTAEPLNEPFADFDAIFTRRIAEADEFYDACIPSCTPPTNGWYSGRPSPDCCGPSSSTTTTSFAGYPVIRLNPHRPKIAGMDATMPGNI